MSYCIIRTIFIKKLLRLLALVQQTLWRRSKKTNHALHMWQGRIPPTSAIIGE